jgi:hypothetical protein
LGCVVLGKSIAAKKQTFKHGVSTARVEYDLVFLFHLYRCHSRVLLVTFETGNEAQETAEALTRELQNGFKRVNGDINSMERMASEADDPEVCKQVQRQLARALMVLTQDFRREETRFLDKV